MLVFVDESGDPGFKLDQGSSPVFVVVMVIFETTEHAAVTSSRIHKLAAKLRVKPEFKFNKCNTKIRDLFFAEIADCRFYSRAVVVRKDKIYSAALRTVKESFYKFFVRMMMEHNDGYLQNAKVVIDGSGDRQFKRQFSSYLKKNIDANCVRKIELKDSIRDPLIQLADMVAGSIARSYRPELREHQKWRAVLERNNQIQNIWEFE